MFPALLVTSRPYSTSCILVLGRSMPVLVINIPTSHAPINAVDISLALIAILPLPVDISHAGANNHVLGGDIPIIARDLHGLHGVAAHLPPAICGKFTVAGHGPSCWSSRQSLTTTIPPAGSGAAAP